MTKVLYRSARRQGQSGMLLIGVLILLALAALGAVQTGQRWFDARQREGEQELLFIGEQYRQAIESYWREAPNKVQQMPSSVDDLLSDKRFPFPKRHLRKEFRDPLMLNHALVEIRSGAALVGVYSEAEGVPFRQSGFDDVQKSFNAAQSYAAWKFSFVPPVVSGQTGVKSPGTELPAPPPPLGRKR
jgi:type II secretory pathway pseudopilin PulG